MTIEASIYFIYVISNLSTLFTLIGAASFLAALICLLLFHECYCGEEKEKYWQLVRFFIKTALLSLALCCALPDRQTMTAIFVVKHSKAPLISFAEKILPVIETFIFKGAK